MMLSNKHVITENDHRLLRNGLNAIQECLDRGLLKLNINKCKMAIYGRDEIPLPSGRQHPSYGDCLEVKREYYQNCSVLGCETHCSQSAAHLYEQFLQVQQIGFVRLGPLYAVRRGGCLELYYCNMVEWCWWDSSLI